MVRGFGLKLSIPSSRSARTVVTCEIPCVHRATGPRFGHMTLLPILYWIVLILSVIGYFAPATWPGGRYLSGGAATVLFIIIGLRIFRIPIQ